MKVHIAKLYFPQNCQNFHFWNKYANGQFISTTDTKHIYVVHSDCSVYGAFGIFIDHYQHISSQEQQKLQKKKKKKNPIWWFYPLCVATECMSQYRSPPTVEVKRQVLTISNQHSYSKEWDTKSKSATVFKKK